MADVPYPVISRHPEAVFPLPTRLRQQTRRLDDAGTTAAADVQHEGGGRSDRPEVYITGAEEGLHHVVRVDEVPALQAVLEHRDAAAVQQPHGEDREDPGVRIP